MIIQDNFGKSHNLKNQPLFLNYNDRVKRGLKAAGFNFLLALVSVFIPVLHFFLVPLFLLLSIYQGFSKFKQTRCINLNEEVCPVCANTLGSGLGFMEGDRLRTTCNACRSKLVIQD